MMVDRERFQEINRMYAKEGIPVMMPEDWTMIDQMAKAISRNDSLRIGPLDSDADAQALAQETIVSYRIAVGMDYPAVGVRRHDGKTEIAEHGGPQYDPHDPMTWNRLYAILAGLPEQLIPLSHEYGWRAVAAERLQHYRICNVRLSQDCLPEHALERFAIKSGEFVPIYASCTACRDWFNLDNFDRRTTQGRPLLGLDFRGGIFRRSNPDPLSDDDRGPWGE
jgi:hypothetical protein